jgi:hypothetical protein
MGANISQLEKKYQKLMDEAFKLSRTDRRKSDAKTAEANLVMDEIVKIKNGR